MSHAPGGAAGALEVPVYLHAWVLDALPEEAKDGTLELRLRTTLFNNGADLLTLGADSLTG